MEQFKYYTMYTCDEPLDDDEFKALCELNFYLSMPPLSLDMYYEYEKVISILSSKLEHLTLREA